MITYMTNKHTYDNKMIRNSDMKYGCSCSKSDTPVPADLSEVKLAFDLRNVYQPHVR